MKKKTICLAGLIMVMLVCLAVYFQPMSLSDSISETGRIHITITEINVQDGEPHMDKRRLRRMFGVAIPTAFIITCLNSVYLEQIRI